MSSPYPDRIFRITEPVTESNCYVIREKNRCMIIDPNDFPAIRELLQKWNMKPELVLLTHEHCDHIGGLNQLRETYPVTVVATQACSEGIGNKTRNMSRMMETFLYFKSGEKTFVHYPPFQCEKADLTFTDQLCCEFGAKELELIRLPGHTPGSMVIRYNGCLFCGDYLLPGDKVVTRLPGGDEDAYEKYARPWLGKIADGTWIFPGHGEPFQMNREVREFHDI
ncbi:MAG TPA: MBL fold hydrolase [Lachnoclostridium sp.]|nr:MBL fold hydrolase [Lachnoclostridium sp.]